jgi:hypothetical protein
MEFLAGTGMSNGNIRFARDLASAIGPNRRAQERERAAANTAAEARRAEAEHRAVADAQTIVAIWNARQASGFYPTIGAAIAAGRLNHLCNNLRHLFSRKSSQ